ncbi:MAG: methylated-DNA--[protein]-cysteine S-methyltransferase [Pelolinea sp.]|nr:methylated-DNA--[protein]-cysteine S-methyltransferase [Pelolinea sp.]
MKLKQLQNNESELSIRLLKSSPVGPILFAASSDGLIALSIITEDDLRLFDERTADPGSARIADEAISQMKDYFDGKLEKFTVPVDLKDVTDFQRDVLLETKEIPFGEVFTYGEVAARIKRPRAARAVGGALASNPIGIIIPCHRVVAQDGQLHGFSSPHGILTKAMLLEIEGVRIENGAVQWTAD